jgi:hypothetical protein
MLQRSELRPIERCVLRLVESDIGINEIARRFRRSPKHIEQVITLSRLPGRSATHQVRGLRPLERCVLAWRAKGASHDEIAPRLRRSAGFVARVEGFARDKLADR